ncbi:hypothetical protein N657DRAFT_658142 [Parathielavia appendiculata]|uniref:Uncharacterized protein n=1 Tax=Parathielavia appendiculata TaxID=2587402 RepID=A0AAN6TU84_9PEZI|nr:hypothetical protein N657DRAFT_658142 [Parathielavia appendiculata]
MSGSGGFYKYRCKYFYTYNCPNWVYCNGHACAMCLAEGRDTAESEPSAPPQQHSSTAWQLQRRQNPSIAAEICVPQAIHGTLRYTVMEIVPTDETSPGAYWVLRQKAMATHALPYSTITTSDTPRPVMTSVGHVGQMAY